jgi:hypothetical protein
MKSLCCKPASIPKARWAAYAAAGVATALGGTPSADAEIHYSGLVNHDFANGPFTGSLDPGVTFDLGVATGTQVGNYTQRFGHMFIRRPPTDQSTIGAFVGTEAYAAGFYVLELPAGKSLPGQRIGNYCVSSSSSTWCIGGSGRFRDRGTGFIGFAFSHDGGGSSMGGRVSRRAALRIIAFVWWTMPGATPATLCSLVKDAAGNQRKRHLRRDRSVC